jgi:exopolysaccharide production protein ExoZ
VFEFLFGMCVAVILSRYRSPRPLLAAGLAVVALAILLWADLAQPAARRWIWLGLPAAVLIAAVVDLERAGRMPKIAWLGRVGGASYSIYLGHVFVIAGARIAIQWSGAAGRLMQPMIFIPLGIVASVGVGMLVHLLIERPLTALSARRLGVA